MSVASLLLPAIRWDAAHGFAPERAHIERALSLGVGGFILFGGEQDAVRALTKELRQRSRVPLLIAADLERGAGQQFTGATGLPPLAAIASLGDVEAVRKAARLTAREARTLGVNWDYAPVVDLDLLADSPVTGTRSLGADPARVGMLAAEWITVCQSEGVLACAKHFPGSGRAITESHLELPVVRATRRELQDDIVPFKAAIDAGVASIMTAHVAYPALDPSGVPATVSREILQWTLRQQMKFDGLVVTDSLMMRGVLAQESEAEAAVGALNAGCDLLLYPRDATQLAAHLDRALGDGVLDRVRVEQSQRRRQKWAQWASPPNEYRRPSGTDVAWGAQLADRTIHVLRGASPALGSSIDVVIIDDDLGGPVPAPSREPLLRALREGAAGRDVRRRDLAPGEAPSEPTVGRAPVVALFGELQSWKGKAGYSAAAIERLDRVCRAAPAATLVQFGHPRLASALGSARTLVCAWGGDAVMQQAAARWLLRQR